MSAFANLLGDLSRQDLVGLLAGAAAFVSVFAAWYGLVERDPGATRARELLARRREMMHRATAKRRRTVRPLTLVARLVKQLGRLQDSQAERVRTSLLRAGFRRADAALLYVVAKLVAPLAAALVGFVLLYLLDLGALGPALKPVAMTGGILAGFMAPDLYLRNATIKRYKAIQASLPDCLDLLVVCAEAGLSLDSSLHRVADELGRSAPEIAEELALTSIELSFLPDRRQALRNLANRVDLPTVGGIVHTLAQTEKYGTPLAQSLRVLAADLREQRMLRAEEKAARLPATLTVPMIVFILPTLFIVLLGPAALGIYDNLTSR